MCFKPREEFALPLSEAAARLGISAKDLRAAVDAGQVPHIRLGENGILVDLDAFYRQLRERQWPCTCEANADALAGRSTVGTGPFRG